MPTVSDVFHKLCEWAPLDLQMDFDNSGFLVGRGDLELDRVLLALDITLPVIEEARDLGARLIVSHHPVIFQSLRQLRDELPANKALLLAENGIAAVCMHTNLDLAEGGVNDVLIRLLGAEPESALDASGCGRIGTLPEALPLPDFLRICRDRLGSAGLRYVDAGRPVHRLAVMGGSGGDALRDAAAMGCDTFVTADLKYHVLLEAAELGVNLIDADHFCTENPVMSVLAQRLREAFPQTEFLLSRRHRQVVSFF